MARHMAAYERRAKVEARRAARARRTATKATARVAENARHAAAMAMIRARTEGGRGWSGLFAAATATHALPAAARAAEAAAEAAAGVGALDAAARLRAAAAEVRAEFATAAPFVRTCGGPRTGGMWYELSCGPERYPARCQGDAGLDLLMAGGPDVTPAQAEAAAAEWRCRYPLREAAMGGVGFKGWAAGAHAAAHA